MSPEFDTTTVVVVLTALISDVNQTIVISPDSPLLQSVPSRRTHYSSVAGPTTPRRTRTHNSRRNHHCPSLPWSYSLLSSPVSTKPLSSRRTHHSSSQSCLVGPTTPLWLFEVFCFNEMFENSGGSGEQLGGEGI
ncbi:Uncharacterized protein Fot_07521 [Forsythia ovata]|uniref:Uncharacterized protein n=1 Tax=Forsythia ovata TaxID=205694 RepID=A0ABD1WW18_9LAMI